MPWTPAPAAPMCPACQVFLFLFKSSFEQLPHSISTSIFTIMHGMQPSSLQDPHQFYLDNSTIINTIILSTTKTTTVSITMTVKNDRNNSNLRIKKKILTTYISTATHCMQPGSLRKPSQCYNHNTTIPQ